MSQSEFSCPTVIGVKKIERNIFKMYVTLSLFTNHLINNQ